jgi:UDP-N-acetylglucosamine--N-acetylmuramyl-(pentapeptide) pyrophosphoryl-undecaprenol N-acetylglucosamine transferase
VIGWYIHHHGRGHLARAQSVRAHLDEPVVALTSLPEPAVHGFDGWVQLARDAGGDPPVDPRAHGRLHWVPLGHPGLAQRATEITGWLAANRPRVMVVDVSVEATLLARLCGVPVVVVAMPGEREDSAHQLAYDVAERIVAAWAHPVYDPPFLRRHAGKTAYVGAFSRFDGVAPAGAPEPTVLVLNGAGGTTVGRSDVDAAQAAVPSLRWTGVGGAGQEWTRDVWTCLSRAAVVVTHAGQNALAEVAAAGRPAIVVAQDRPFGEQHAVTEALRSHGIAVGLDSWPEPSAWPALIETAHSLGGAGWRRWSTGHGAADAAAVIASVGTDAVRASSGGANR